MERKNTAKLHRNVQFIYERALAEQELRSFGIEEFQFESENPWTVHFNGGGRVGEFLARSAYFESYNDTESVYKRLILPKYQGGSYNITRSVNQYLTHWIYPYKGKFHPQMIRALLNILRIKPGQLVLDPFVGSGTAALECMLMGIDFIGIDISPLCALIGRVKTQAWQVVDEIAELVASKKLPGPGATATAHDFFRLASLVTESDVAVRKRDRLTYYERNLQKMLTSIEDLATAKKEFKLNLGSVSVLHGDCRDTAALAVGACSVDVIITSPPYSIALDYVKNDAHALRAMDQDLHLIREDFIGVRGKQSAKMGYYKDDMKVVFKEMARVLKPGGQAVVVIGNATNKLEVTTTEEMKGWGEPFGLRFQKEMSKIVFGLYSVITDEKLLFFEKEG